MAEGFSRQLQESLLALLVFDDQATMVVRAAIKTREWDQAYRELAIRIYEYVDKYKKAPKDHATELLDDLLQSKDIKQAVRYERILRMLGEIHDRGLNAEYLITKLQTFVRRQAIKNAIIECSPIIQTGRDDRLPEVEKIFNAALTTTSAMFDPGTRLSDRAKVLAGIDNPTEVFLTGIEELDKRRLGLARKTCHLMLGPAKGGKSWWLSFLGRMAALSGKRVAHITLENSEKMTVERYMQTFFAIAKRKDQYFKPIVRVKGEGYKLELKGSNAIKQVKLKPQITMDHQKFRRYLSKKLKQAKPALDNVFVKEFPTGELTIAQLEGYLDMLERTEDFVPDIVILDYPDLMELPARDFRVALGMLIKQLRGLAVRRNLALGIVSQIGRKGAESASPTETTVAEDWSKIATADVVLVLQQTPAEKQLGLARLLVAAARNEQDKFVILLTQSLAIGQFALTSRLLPINYLGPDNFLQQITQKGKSGPTSSTEDEDEE